MEREWELGLKLRVALQNPDTGKLSGFMRVCDALVSGSDPDADNTTPGQRKRARFAGMVLEKLNGWEVYKRIDMHGKVVFFFFFLPLSISGSNLTKFFILYRVPQHTLRTRDVAASVQCFGQS
jgi:hypothetical protein